MNSFDKSKIGAISSSIVVIFGCYAPWLKFGSFVSIRGIDGFDGAVVLTLAIITGVIAYFFQKNESAPTGLYGISGSIILIIALINIFGATNKAKEMADGFRDLQHFFRDADSISILSFLGPGAFMILIGSIGLMISAFFASNSNLNRLYYSPSEKLQEPTNKSNELTDKIEPADNVNDVSKKLELNEEEQKVELLNSLMLEAKKSMFASSKISKITDLLNEMCTSRDQCVNLLDTYSNLCKSDLIAKLIDLSSSYETKKFIIRPFIEFDIVEESYPHNRKAF